ncbi:MAG: hypothetical protein QW757_03660 [Candidatus Woesearchaeota archaeon]
MRFIDVCFPRDNEYLFIEVAKKIKTNELIFVYEKKELKKTLNFENIEKNELKIHNFWLEKDIYSFKENIKNLKNKLCYIDNKFKFPDRLTQVYVKNIKENNIRLIISPKILKNNSYELSKFILFLKLCRKYKIDLFITSLAETPYELKEKRLLFSFMNILTRDTNYSKKSLSLFLI